MDSAALIVVGDEILSGKVEDLNGPLVIRTLRSAGVELRRIAVVGDDLDDISAEVRRLSGDHRWLITSGGIGPTHDDLTVVAVAAAFGLPVVRDPALERTIRRLWRGPVTAAALRNADVPAGSRLLAGPDPYLPAVVCRNVYLLPGVPEIFAAKIGSVATEMVGTPRFERAVRLRCRESVVADTLGELQTAHPTVRIGSYPRLGTGYRVRVTMEGLDPDDVDRALTALLDAVRTHVVEVEG